MRSTLPSRLPLYLLGVLLLGSGPAAAFDFELPWLDLPASFQIDLSSMFEYHDDNYNRFPDDDRYFDLKNRLNLKLTVDRFSFSGRFDSNSFFDSPPPSRNQYNPYYRDRYAPEKLTAAWRGDDLQVVLGDFYATVGRGLALTIRKTDQLGEDDTLLGAKLSWRHGPLEILVLSGLSNPANLNLFGKTLPDPYDLISAGRLAWRPTEGLTLAAHGVGIVYDPLERNPKAQQERILPEYTAIAGASVQWLGLFDRLDLYAEANWLGRQDRTIPGVDPDDPAARPPLSSGWGAYFSASLALGDFDLLAEAKTLDDFYAYTLTWQGGGKYTAQRIDYLQPPTLEPADMEVTNNHDLGGGRLRLDYRPGGGDTLLFASYAGFWAQDLQSAGHRFIYNLNGGVEQDFLGTGRARLQVGLREETPRYAGGNRYHLLYVGALLKVPVSARHSFDLHGTTWFVREVLTGAAIDFVKGDWSLEYSWSPWLAVGLLFGYDTSPSRGEEPYDFSIFYRADQDAPVLRQLFLAGSLSVNLWQDYLLRLLAGQMRGGLLCVGGVCRELPPFAGVRAELVLSF